MLEDLERVLRQLKLDGKVDEKHFPHALIGIYKGCYTECYVQSDFLLIYIDIDEEKQIIKLVRRGSHPKLFK